MTQSALIASKNVKFAISDSELPKNNHLARLEFDGIKYPHLVEVAQFLRQSCIAYAITVDPTPSKALLQQFWFTAEETSLTNKKGEQVPAISFSTQLGSGMMTALGLRKALRFPDKSRNGFDALPTDAELIQFLDAMEYAWEPKPRSTIPNKKLTLVKKALMPSQLNYVFSHIIQCMSGKSGSLDQASKVQVQMAYSVIAGRNFDYATAIFDDLKSKIEKTERDPKIPYVRFICAYLKFLYPTTYPTNSDASFPKVGQRSLEVKTLPNEVSISQLRSRLSLLTSSSSAATQEVPSSAIPAATPSKRPSTGSLGPSKKAKVTKEKATSSSIPKDVSLQTSLDDFVGLSSTSSAQTTTTVPAISVAVTTVTKPAVTTPIPTSSIPISSPPISLVSTTQLGPIGPEHHSFEESLQFYKMFDNSGNPITLYTSPNSPYKPGSEKLTYLSGPSLATVDTNVNNLSSKVDSLSASLNNTTSAVQTAGDALKTLTATCASKADLSHIATLQAAIVKVREESKQQYDDLSAKIDACTTTLQQVLDKLNAPAPVPAPSFTEDDRSALTIAVEFIHLATSDIPALEGRLTGLEAEVQKLATATTSSPQDLSLVDNDKEGEKTAEENTDAEVIAEPPKETPSQVEGEIVADKAPPTIAEIVDDEEEDEDDDEDLDLEDQVDDSHQDDDDDDEEDPSLWCSSAVTSSAIASKEVIQAGGRQGSSSGTPSQSKGASAKETLMMISLPEENPSQFSPLLKGSELQIIPAAIAEEIIPISIAEIDDEEEEDSLVHPGRPSQPSHGSEEVMKKRAEMIAQLESQRLKVPLQTSFSELDFLTKAEREESAKAEKLIAECRRDAQLALKIQSSQVKDKKLKRKPVEVQAALLKEIEEERSKEQEINDKSIEWCKQKMDYRSDLLPITVVTISGRKKKDQLSVTMEITREDGTQKAMYVSKLEGFGFTEWIEFWDALKKSKSTYRGYVEGLLKALINRVTSVLNLPSPIPPNPKKLKRRIGSSSSEDVAIIRNETSIKFSRDALFGPPPDLSVLDLSLPPGGPFQAGQVIDHPYGIFFRDDDEELRFQRVSEIPICPLNHLKDLLCLWCDFFPAAEKIKEIISQESLERRQKGEEIPEYMINPPKSSYS
ncbi:hypothetical protein L6452_37733 [Arctium lappa]|uniref:Uncharacterized protein n=1 Tax=Arctium lappa TaxID=4217 RepID=A0ACB8Y4B0_ARCLA|nr:hypothetical protein L6452_37733 [Arctium lappa]